MNVRPLNGAVPPEQLEVESTEDKYTEVALEVLSLPPPSSSRDRFSKLVHCAAEELIGKTHNVGDLHYRCMKNAIGIFLELFRISSKSLKEERVSQFIEFIEAFRGQFVCDPPFEDSLPPPLDFLANKALIVICCQRLIDQLRDLEEHTSNFSPEHNSEGLRTYLLNSGKLPMSFTGEIRKCIKIIQSYHQLDGLIQDNNPHRIDQLRLFEARLADLLSKLEDLIPWNGTYSSNRETVINQIRGLQHLARDIKELTIDLDEDRPIPPLQDMCIDVLLKGRIDSVPYEFFSSFVRCSLNCAAKELIGKGELSYGYLSERCMRNAVDIFYELLRMFPQSEEKRRLGQFIKFIEAFRKKFGCDPSLKSSSNPTLDFLANKALMVAWCRRLIDELSNFEKRVNKFSSKDNNEGLRIYLLDSEKLPTPSFLRGLKFHLLSPEVLPRPSVVRETERYIEIIQAYQLDDRIKENKSQIDQLRNLEGRLSDLFSQLKDFIMPWMHEENLDPETVINRIRDFERRIREINELAIGLSCIVGNVDDGICSR